MGLLFFFFSTALLFDIYHLMVYLAGLILQKNLAGIIPSPRISFFIPLGVFSFCHFPSFPSLSFPHSPSIPFPLSSHFHSFFPIPAIPFSFPLLSFTFVIFPFFLLTVIPLFPSVTLLYHSACHLSSTFFLFLYSSFSFKSY